MANLTLRAKRLARRILGPLRPSRPIPVHTYQHWSIGIAQGDSPLSLRTSPGPALTSGDITDIRALFVADPFLMQAGKGWDMFFELFNLDRGRGTIGLAHSDDGLNWQYAREVLIEPFHLSYPNIYTWDGQHYMVPETGAAGSVRLYRAARYPDGWVYERDLLQAPHAVDASPFEYGGQWWMFVDISEGRCDTVHLFGAADLRGPWKEHPASPIVRGDPRRARPAGKPLLIDGRLIRLAQDCVPVYGAALRAFEVIELTPTSYREQELPESPLFAGTGYGWNALGMHHLDAHQLGSGSWIAAIDGCRTGIVPAHRE